MVQGPALPPLAKSHAAMGWDPRFVDRSPWLARLGEAAAPFVDRPDWPTIDELTEAAEDARARLAPDEPPVRFVEAIPKAKHRGKTPRAIDDLYDVRIARHGEIPTRARNLHDFYNALRWIAFPRAKRRLHARQCRALLERVEEGARRLPDRRTREQDTLTLFDEGGVVLLGDEIVLFGHALLEHVHASYAPIRGATIRLDASAANLDARLAAAIDDVARFQSPEGFGAIVLRADGSASAR